MCLNSRDNKVNKKGTTPEAQKKVEQGTKAKKTENTRKQKKNKDRYGQYKRPALVATRANVTQAAKRQKKKQCDGPRKDISKMIYYNGNKKGHYATDCTKLKNYLKSRRPLHQ